MKTRISLVIAMGLFGLAATGLHAQVAINNSAANPDASAILDLKSGNAGVNKGFLPQSVALTNVTVAAPVTAPATGLIVYSSTAPTGGNGAGYYYWTGSAWASMGGSSGVGGSGTANEVAFWTGANTISSDTSLYWNGSKLGVGTSHPFESIDINQTATPNTAKFGNSQPVCFVANSPMVGFNAYWNFSETYFSSSYAGMIEFNQNVPGAFQILTAPLGTAGNAATMTPAMTIVNSGAVGIGTAGPSSALQVTGPEFNTGIFNNNVTSGTAITGAATGGGNSWGMEGYTSSGGGIGVLGENQAASGTGTGSGVYATTSQSTGYGAQGINYYNSGSYIGSGVGIYGIGGGGGGTLYTYGEGVYGEGTNIGVWGSADAASGSVWPVYGSNDNGLRYAGIAYWNGATDYKIIGSGTVSTVIKDNNNVPRIMNCPEAPEILFEDYGSGTLTNGRVHIALDATYAKNVTINGKHPLRVLITLEGDCNGVYVTNKTATGFDVVELKAGTSNVAFTYEVIANRADAYDANGNLISQNADNRFQQGPAPMMGTKSTAADPVLTKPAAPAYVAAPRVNPQGVTTGASTLNQK